MNALDGLFALAAATVVFTAVAGRHRITAWIAAAAFAAQFALLVATGALHGEALASALRVEVFGQTLGWRLDALGWFFAAITLGAAFVAALYAGGLYIGKGREMHPVQFALALNVLAMLMLVASADLLTLFVGWEFVSWASFLFMAIGGGPAPAAALRYLTYAIAGAMAILAGIALVWSAGGDLGFSALPSAWAALSTGGRFALVLLFVAGFGAKMGLLPLHLWQAGAYAHAPGPGAAFLGAISSRMGLFAMAVVPMQFIGLDALRAGLTIFGGFDLFDLFAWVAAATIILPTFTALRQNDARLLLAWHPRHAFFYIQYGFQQLLDGSSNDYKGLSASVLGMANGEMAAKRAGHIEAMAEQFNASGAICLLPDQQTSAVSASTTAVAA